MRKLIKFEISSDIQKWEWLQYRYYFDAEFYYFKRNNCITVVTKLKLRKFRNQKDVLQLYTLDITFSAGIREYQQLLRLW